MPLAIEHLPADIFGLDELQRAALTGLVAGVLIPSNASSIPACEDRFARDERQALVAHWQSRLAELEPPVHALDALRSLSSPGSSIVLATTTTGFLGGPLASLHAALRAVSLAGALTRLHGAPVVPVLLNSSDEDTRAEVALVGPDLEPRAVSLPGLLARAPVTASGLRLDAGRHALGPLRELVRSLLWEGEHRERALELFFPRDGEDLGRSFSRVMSDLLGHLGVVLLEPAWLREELAWATAELLGGVSDPRAAGERSGADGRALDAEQLTATFVHHLEEDPSGARSARALRAGGDGFRYDGEEGSRTPAELAALILQSPAEWSPGPLIRTSSLALVLPVAVAVGDRKELGQLAAVAGLARSRGVPPIPFVPRVSATLVEPECERALERLALDLREVLGGSLARGAAEGDDGRALEAVSLLREIAASSAARLLEARTALARVDPGLAVQLKRTASQVRALVEQIAGRAERAERNRRAKTDRHARRLAACLLPGGRPQEEVLGTLAFVARHGRAWIDELAAEIDPVGCEHLAVHLDRGA